MRNIGTYVGTYIGTYICAEMRRTRCLHSLTMIKPGRVCVSRRLHIEMICNVGSYKALGPGPCWMTKIAPAAGGRSHCCPTQLGGCPSKRCWSAKAPAAYKPLGYERLSRGERRSPEEHQRYIIHLKGCSRGIARSRHPSIITGPYHSVALMTAVFVWHGAQHLARGVRCHGALLQQ